MSKFAVAVAAACLVAMTGPVAAQVSMPPDLRIVPPRPEVPGEVARFAGGWSDEPPDCFSYARVRA